MARSRRKIRKNVISMLKDHSNRRHLVLGVLPVALFLMVAVAWSLHVNAITLSDDPICGIEEHTHTADCYAWVTLDESTETAGTITTTTSSSQNEIAGTETEEPTETEELTETETGTEAVTESTEETADDPQEGDTKVVDGVTYVYTLTCGKEEHTHTVDCFVTETKSESSNSGIMLMSVSGEDSESETGSEEETASITLTASTAYDFSKYADVTWSYDKVTYDDGTFTVDFNITFDSLTKEEIQNAGYTFILTLPEGIEVPDDLIDTEVSGYVTGYNGAAFSYTIRDAGDGTYYMEITFTEDYVDTLADEATLSGEMKFEATCEVSNAEIDSSNGDVTIGTGSATIKIDAGEIETDGDENDNWLADLTVTKSASSYDSSNNSITYTVVIYSKNGTEEIKLTDLLNITDNLGYSNTGMSAESVGNISVTYYSQYYSWGGYSGTSTTIGTDSTEAMYYTITSDEDYNLVLTLSALNGRSSTETNSYVIGDCYVITYTVYFDPESAEYNSSITNQATATSETVVGTVTDYATTTKTAVGHMATKYGTYNSSTNTITWTITFNATGADIAGYTLTDEAFANAADLTITSSSASASDSDYTINYETDTNGNSIVTSITFNATDTDEDDDSSTNTNTYTITYTTTTDSTLGSSAHTVTNEVDITDSNGQTAGETEGSAYVSSSGSMAKSQTATGEIDSTNGTRAITWTTTVYVPSGGIASGTVLYDNVGCWYGDTTYRSSSEADQWFTYDQIVAFFYSLVTYGILDDNGDTAIEYDDGANFTLAAYDPESDSWISYDTLSKNQSTYENTLFTAYSITFAQDISYTGVLKLSYSTTVNIEDVLEMDSVTSQTYYNTAKVGGITASGTYTEYESLYKTDGSGNRDESKISLDEDGNLTWIVKFYIAPGSTDTYDITDTLPEGLSFVSAKIEISSDSATLDASTANVTTGIMDTAYWKSNTTGKDTDAYGIVGKITTTTYTNDTMIITLDATDYSWLVQSGGYVTITYTIQIDNFDTADLSGYSSSTDGSGNTVYSIGSYKNIVEVGTLTDNQTQTVTYTEEAGGGSGETTHDTVIKDGTYKASTGLLTYQVALNIDGDELNNGNVMTFTDVATTYSNDSYGTRITLQNGSVKFYELHKLYVEDTINYFYYLDSDSSKVYLTTSSGDYVTDLTNTDVSDLIYSVTEDDGTSTYYYKTELSIAWIYEENDTGWGTVYHTITSTEIPDSTPILVEYQYNTTTVSGNEYLSISNTATLTGDSETEGSDYNQENDQWSEPTASASLNADGGLTIIKVDENNYSITIPDTKFALYKYDSTSLSWVQVTADDYNYYIDSNGDETAITDSYTNPMDANNYLTTDSSGALTITKNYVDSNGTTLGTYSWYEPYTLYYIVEVEAATGYTIISSNTIYFYWSDDDTSGSLTWPTGMYSWNTTVIDLNETPTQKYVTNGEVTTFTLVKTDKSDGTTTLSGATFALYKYAGLDSSGNEVWKRIGTYITDKNGEISITYDDSLYTYNQAYKLTEISSADGYNIAWGDETEFYFWWVSDDTSTYPENIPSNWGDGDNTVTAGTTYASAIDISSASETVTATNTKTTTTISAKKVWIDENGNSVVDDNYSAKVQLYYYLGDEYGTPINAASSSGTELLTLTTTSGRVANTTVELYSDTSTVSGTELGSGWSYLNLSSVSEMIASLYDEDYTDGYVEVIVKNGDTPDYMQLILQAGNTYSYAAIAQISLSEITTTIDSNITYYTVLYSIEDIKSAIASSGYTASDVVSVFLNWASSSGGTGGTVESLSVLGAAATTSATPISTSYKFDSTNNWYTVFWNDSYVPQDGAVLKIDYSGATEGSGVYVCIRIDDQDYEKLVTLEASSGTVYVSVADIIGTNTVDWTANYMTYIRYSWDSPLTTDGTVIDNVTVLLPATATTTTQQYVEKEIYETTDETKALVSSWTGYFYASDYSSAASYLDTEGAVIYIDYTCTEVPSWAQIGIYYSTGNYEQYNDLASLFSTGTNNKLAIPVSYFKSGSYDLSNYSYLYLCGDADKVTINSISILIPYSAASEVSGTLIDADYTVTLYAPDLGTLNFYNNTTVTTTEGDVTYSSYAWNTISSRATEPTINASSLNDTSKDNAFTGYAFLDAIYANTSSTVEIVLSNVTSDNTDLATELKNMQLIIQGDLSTGTEGYTAIASVTPTEVTYDAASETYTLVYSSSDIISSLYNSTANYTSASDAYADYNALVLSLTGDTQSSISATIASLTVVSEELSTTATYTESNLIGTIYGGVPYTDSNDTEYTYKLNSTNNWTVAVYNLPLTYTSGGVTYYYYYYFVETEYSGGSTSYTVTYSQTEGENGGGEIVITNITTTYVLPGSGGIGTGVVYLFGVLLLGLGVVLIVVWKIQPGMHMCGLVQNRRDSVRRRRKRKIGQSDL